MGVKKPHARKSLDSIALCPRSWYRYTSGGRAPMALKILAGILLVLFLLLAGLWIYHITLLKKERASYPPPGRIYEILGDKLHLYTEGTGKPVVVFLAGSGTSSPVLDFKVLYEQLTNNYTIAVVERPGYGWSERGNSPRDITTIIQQSRGILTQAGLTPPYVLAAHSMGALEALAWAALYPDEVTAVIGLDPAVPDVYSYLKLPGRILQSLLFIGARIGITRIIPEISSPGVPDSIDVDAYCAMVHRNTLSADMIREIRNVLANAQYTAGLGIPEVPLLFFDSGGAAVGVKPWSTILRSYIDSSPEGVHIILEGSHYIHHTHPEKIVQEIREFLQDAAGRIE